MSCAASGRARGAHAANFAFRHYGDLPNYSALGFPLAAGARERHTKFPTRTGLTQRRVGRAPPLLHDAKL